MHFICSHGSSLLCSVCINSIPSGPLTPKAYIIRRPEQKNHVEDWHQRTRKRRTASFHSISRFANCMKNPILATIPREELYFYKVILNYLFHCVFYLRSAVTYYIFRKRYFYKLQNAIPYLFKYICIYKRWYLQSYFRAVCWRNSFHVHCLFF